MTPYYHERHCYRATIGQFSNGDVLVSFGPRLNCNSENFHAQLTSFIYDEILKFIYDGIANITVFWLLTLY